MKYKFRSICINVTKYDVTFATKGGFNPQNLSVATPLVVNNKRIARMLKCIEHVTMNKLRMY